MLYFAYGSNMNWDQISKRCPSAQFDSVAKAVGYRLAFTRFSEGRNCGVTDIVASPGSEVWGVIFVIFDLEIDDLDKSEGYRPLRARGENAYERRQFEVVRQGCASAVTVWTYFVVNKLKMALRPSAAYKALILDGARHWHLPARYVDELERIKTQ